MVAEEQPPIAVIPPLTSNVAVQRQPSFQSSLESDLQPDGIRVKVEDDGFTANDKQQQGKPEERQTGDDEASNLHITSLFAALPTYGPPTSTRKLQYSLFKITSFILSLLFLLSIVCTSMIVSIPMALCKAFYTCTFRNYDKRRIFYAEELRRAETRRAKERAWKRRMSCGDGPVDQEGLAQRYQPTEGGRDPIISDVAYYARRVGLDVEKIKVKTEDGFLIDLWHVFDPSEYTSAKDPARTANHRVFQESKMRLKNPDAKRKAPVLMLHGLLQSSGAFCCSDDESLAFWLCKAGYDVWLGNNRCGLDPRHEVLRRDDPRMWCWNLNQMGAFDLSALIDRVLLDTGFPKLGLVCHSQGTAQTFVALAKEQRPELGGKISVFCALAPAVYAGPLIKNLYFRFVRLLSVAWFRLVFGVHAFIPFMMQMHGMVPPKMYGWLGYQVFSYLFGWTDGRWDRGLRDRFFQFAPVHVSAETMRWWLGSDGFAKHKCVLATKETVRTEDRIDQEDLHEASSGIVRVKTEEDMELRRLYGRGATAWYDERVPPMALWVCEKDELVDGRRLLRRFGNGREPHMKLVHSKVVDGYEHLDVLWAMDAVDQVFVEVREVLWKTWTRREECIVPDGCEGVAEWQPAAM